MKRFILALLACLALAGCSDRSANSAEVKGGAAPGAPGAHQLLFFINPNGAPCQMQAQILDGMRQELQGRATIRLVQTTVAADEPLFYRYGIRGLPMLLLTDASGNEIRRLSPGVKRAEEIRVLLQAIAGRS